MKFQIVASLALALSSASAFTPLLPLSRDTSRVPFTVSKMSDVTLVETEIPSTPTFRAGENNNTVNDTVNIRHLYEKAFFINTHTFRFS